jgi:hypothetical protein
VRHRQKVEEGKIMRLSILACGLGALALAGFVYGSDPAEAAKSKMGCERGKEVWNATSGKCEKGKPKKAAKTAAKKAAPAKKK